MKQEKGSVDYAPFPHGPFSIRDRLTPESKYEAECVKCGWAMFRFDYNEAVDRLMMHQVDRHESPLARGLPDPKRVPLVYDGSR